MVEQPNLGEGIRSHVKVFSNFTLAQNQLCQQTNGSLIKNLVYTVFHKLLKSMKGNHEEKAAL